MWASFFLAALKIDVTMDTIVQFFGPISMAIGGLNMDIRMYEFARLRHRVTNLTAKINEKVCLSKLMATKTQIRDWNYLYLILIWITLIILVIAGSFSFSMTIFSVVTGEHYAPMWLPFARPSFGLYWWLELMFQQTIFLFVGAGYTGMETLFLDCVLQLSFIYHVNNERLLYLSGRDPECASKLVNICRELVDLKT